MKLFKAFIITGSLMAASLDCHAHSATMEQAKLCSQKWTALLSGIDKSTMIISGAEMKMFAEMRPYISRAISIRNSLLADTEFMYSVAMIYAVENELAYAESALKQLANNVPGVTAQTKFKEISNFILEKTQDKKQSF